MLLPGNSLRNCIFLACVMCLILSTNEKYLELAVGSNVTIECRTFGNQTVWWTLNNKNITDTKRYKEWSLPQNKLTGDSISDFSNISFVHSLRILNVTLVDEGNISCHAFNFNRTSISDFLMRPYITPHVVDHSPAIIKASIGEVFKLYCLINAYPLKFLENNMKWTKNDAVLDVNEYIFKTSHINNKFLNTSIEVTEAMKKHNGTYSCTHISYAYENSTPKITVLVLSSPQVSIDYVKAVGSSDIFLNWTINDGNSPIKKYFVQYLAEGAPAFTYYNHEIDGKNLSCVLNHFQPNTKYQLKISAKNEVGTGPIHLHHEWVQTLNEDPIFIPKIETTGSSASTITIGWQAPPNNILEYIQYYELAVFTAGNLHKPVEQVIHQQNSRNLPYMFDNLLTATAYEFKARACNNYSKICGPWSDIVNGTTMDGMASKPENLMVTCSHFNISRRTTLEVTWEKPQKQNGKVMSYLIQLHGHSSYHFEGKYINESVGPSFRSIDEPNHKTVYEGVYPNTNYTVIVSGRTRNKKLGEPATASCRTPITIPDNLGRVNWSKIRTAERKWITKIVLPKISQRNGKICCYRIYIVRMSSENKDLPLPEDMVISTFEKVHEYNNSKGGTYLAEMLSESIVLHKNDIFLGDGKRDFSDEESKMKSDKICQACASTHHDTTSNTIFDINNDIVTKIDDMLVNISDTYSSSSLYITTALRQSKTRRIAKNAAVEHKRTHVMENNTHSVKISKFNIPKYNIFDGEFDLDSNYSGFLEVVVRSDIKDQEIISSFSSFFDVISPKSSMKDYGSDNIKIALNLVMQILCVLVLFMIFLLVALWSIHCFYGKAGGYPNETLTLRESIRRTFCGGRASNHRQIIGSALGKSADIIGPIQKHDLALAFISRHKDTDYGFLREFEMLPNRFNDRTCKHSELKENFHKNRYPDIKAYDQTRVKLSLVNSTVGSDYINANFAIGYKERKKFICAQGPMEGTITDFWRMIWEQHLEIIVMLTNLEEYNKSKCAQYWPEKTGDVKLFGDITVVYISEKRLSDNLIRKLDITKRNVDNDETEEIRHITQYHYLVWKDFTAPEHPYGLIQFIRQINSDYSVQRGPILVHCSAGVGRTGTLVALDSLMQQLEEEDSVSIYNTVCDLRHQRNYLVQSLRQYIFLYRALLDIAQFGYTELHVKFLNSAVEKLKNIPNDGKEKCKLEQQFSKIEVAIDETNKTSLIGIGIENLSKNRSAEVIPFDRNRVILTPIATKEHTSYINASFIEGYDNTEAFIITQDPLESTMSDFWRMLFEQRTKTLVMLSEVGDGPRKCPRYWCDDEIRYDDMTVKYLSSESCPYYSRREFLLKNCTDEDYVKVTQFQYNGWPTVEGEVPEVCRGIIELLHQTKKHHNEQGSTGPIVVHCSLGTDRSSIFVAMCILVQEIETEKKVDICKAARKLRSQRPLLLNGYAQYEFLHRAIINYADLYNLSN